MKTKKMRTAFILFLMIVVAGGCSNETPERKIGTIAIHSNSDYEETLQSLNLGMVFDFHLNIPKSDRRWIHLWVESYHDQNIDEPIHVTDLQFTHEHSDKAIRVGCALINPDLVHPSIVLYGAGATSRFDQLEEFFEGATDWSWDYAIPNQTVDLTVGKEMVLGLVRKEGPYAGNVDYQDPEVIRELVQDHEGVLVLKMEIKDHP